LGRIQLLPARARLYRPRLDKGHSQRATELT
jgi:hypothetical protein